MENVKILTPNSEQIEWADSEIGVIIHFDMPTFEPSYNFRESWGYQPSPKIFNPANLNTDKWIEAAVSAGAKYAVLVAKHCTGFCLWPTKLHSYSIASSPWKDGKGDIVGDFFKSCEKYGVRPGLYYSASCNAYLDVDGKVRSGKKEDQDRYNQIVIEQLTELWTNYGKVFEIWFDGGVLPIDQGGPDVAGLLHRLQPDAVVFQGPAGTKSGLRWVGNESAIAPEDCYATIDFAYEAFDGGTEAKHRGGNPFGDTWRPAESDMPNRDAGKSFQGGWFWKDGEEQYIFPAEYLYERYLTAVGRNTNLLIGMVIDNTGDFPAKDTAEFKKLGMLIKENFSTPLLCTDICDDCYEYNFTLPDNAKYLVICEDIAYGERILDFTVNSYSGHAVGHKRIISLKDAGISDGNICFKITESKAPVKLKSITIY